MGGYLHLLPSELFVDIISRLPAETLIRCTSVCKSWYSLITSPSFITTHLNQTIRNRNNQNKILVRDNSSFAGTDHYSVHRDNETFDNLANVDFPLDGKSRIIGSCNGLLCLSVNEFDYNKHTMYLWNPSIRKFLEIPRSRRNLDESSIKVRRCTVGFGFNPRTNDYKVVSISRTSEPPEVELYELSTGSWRSISNGCVGDLVIKDAPQAFLNGVVHWAGYQAGCSRKLIVSFDMKKDEFGALMVPSSVEEERTVLLHLSVIQDSLALIQDVFVYNNHYYFCIWVMKEYGASESWTKVTKHIMVGVYYGGLHRLVGFRENGDVLIAYSPPYSSGIQYLISYDPMGQKIKDLGISGMREGFYIDTTYVGSLVLLKEGLRSDKRPASFLLKVDDDDNEGQGNKGNGKRE